MLIANALQIAVFNRSCFSYQLWFSSFKQLFYRTGTRQFYTQLQQYPQDIIPIMDNVFNTVYMEMFGEIDGGRRIQVYL